MKRMIRFLRAVFVIEFLVVISGCGNSLEESISNDVTIGNQLWMAKNLDVSTFRNGDPILEAKTEEEWLLASENGQPAWCYYENDATNGEQYGKLYNWYAVNDPRELAPAGYHIPKEADWTILTNYLGGEDIAGGKMKSKSGWYTNEINANESGFSAFPGGIRLNGIGFSDIGEFSYWWTKGDKIDVWGRGLSYYNNKVDKINLFRYEGGMSVRCIKD